MLLKAAKKGKVDIFRMSMDWCLPSGSATHTGKFVIDLIVFKVKLELTDATPKR